MAVTITSEAAASAETAAATSTAEPALAISSAAAASLHGLEAIIGISRGGRVSRSSRLQSGQLGHVETLSTIVVCDSYLRCGLGVVVRPGLRGGRSWSGVGCSLGLRSVGRLLNFNPLLRSSHIVTLMRGVPLLPCRCIGSAVSNIRVRNRDLTLALGTSRGFNALTVCEGGVSTGIDLGQAGVGHRRVSLDRVRLSRDCLILYCSRLSLVQRSGVGCSLLLDSCDCGSLVERNKLIGGE